MADEDLSAPFHPEDQGRIVCIVVTVGYPGSKITDITIGNAKFQVANEDLRMAGQLYLDIESGETTQPSAYDVEINTLCVFSREEDLQP